MFLKLKKLQIINLLLIAITLPLVACGGGGGGSESTLAGSTPTGTAPTTPIAINSANAATIVSQALSVDTDFAFIGAEVSSSQPIPKVSDLSKNLIDHMSKNRGNGVSLVGAAVTRDCDNIGTGTVTSDDNSTLANGTYTGSLSVSFNNCLQGTITTNGSFSFSGSGAENGSSLIGTFTINNLTSTDSLDNLTFSINGAFKLDDKTVGTIETSSISGTLLEYKLGNDVVDISNFNMSYVYDSATNIETANINYTVSSTILNGSYSIETTQPLKQNLSRQYPFEGQVVFTGAQGSKCRVTVNAGTGISTDTVTLDVDANGDGTYESTQILSWAQLAAL